MRTSEERRPVLVLSCFRTMPLSFSFALGQRPQPYSGNEQTSEVLIRNAIVDHDYGDDESVC